MTSHSNASVKQYRLSLSNSGDETMTREREGDAPVDVLGLMERVVERSNLFRALKQVKSNKGGPGIDGMTVGQLSGHLKKHWPRVKIQLLNGEYKPSPLKRVEIPKEGGGVRKLGIPTVVDRFIQQAIMQVLQEDWDSTFSEYSFGFRPGRSQHQAISCVQEYLKDGYRWVVDLDLEKFFDSVNHDVLMSRVKRRVSDRRVLVLINRFLKAGVVEDGELKRTKEGTPQGGPLSPLLSNLLLDELDKELENRGHKFARFADDCNIYVKSRVSGERVLASVTRFLRRKLRLKVNAKKSAVARPSNRRFLGFTFTKGFKADRRKVSDKALKKFKRKARQITKRTRGRTIIWIVSELREYLLGWKAYYGFAEVVTQFQELDRWIRRKLRCYLWKQWGRKGYKMLRKCGVSHKLASQTKGNPRGPWQVSKSQGLNRALPNEYFIGLGLPELAPRKH